MMVDARMYLLPVERHHHLGGYPQCRNPGLGGKEVPKPSVSQLEVLEARTAVLEESLGYVHGTRRSFLAALAEAPR